MGYWNIIILLYFKLDDNCRPLKKPSKQIVKTGIFDFPSFYLICQCRFFFYLLIHRLQWNRWLYFECMYVCVYV